MAVSADAMRSRLYRARHPERLKEITRRSYVKNRDKKLEYGREYQASHPEQNRDKSKRYYRTAKGQIARRERSWRDHGIVGMTVAKYDEMFLAQRGLCAICKREQSAAQTTGSRRVHLSVDHDHVTGQIRGLLCNRCNRAMGYFNDSSVLIEAVLSYLGGAPSLLRSA